MGFRDVYESTILIYEKITIWQLSVKIVEKLAFFFSYELLLAYKNTSKPTKQ